MADVIMKPELMRNMVAILRQAEVEIDTAVTETYFIVQNIEEERYITGDTADRMVSYVVNVMRTLAVDIRQRLADLAVNVDGARAAIEDSDSNAASRFH